MFIVHTKNGSEIEQELAAILSASREENSRNRFRKRFITSELLNDAI